MSGSIERVRIAGRELEARYLATPHVTEAREPIVLLHEALGSISHWRDLPERLAAATGREVLVYSRPGHGWSEGPPEPRTRRYYEQQALEVLPAMLQHFGITHPVLLGHSEGAAIALIYAAQSEAAQSQDAEGHAAQHHHAARALILESPILVGEPAAAAGMAIAERAWHETDFRSRLARHHRDPDSVFAAWLSIRGSESLLRAPLAAVLPVIETPILLLQGERDEYATALQVEALRPIAPHLEAVILPGLGHTPHREQRELFLEHVMAFLSRLGPQLTI